MINIGLEWLDEFRKGMEVRRAHGQPIVRSYTNGHHTANAIAIAERLCAVNHLSPWKVVLALLIHDAPEHHTGDIPGPTKARPEVKQELDIMEYDWYSRYAPSFLRGMLYNLSYEEQVVFKAADKLELLWWCVEEKEMGNSRIGHMYLTSLKGCVEHCEQSPEIDGQAQIIDHLTERWRMTNK